MVYTIIRKRQIFHQLANLPTDHHSIAKSLANRKTKFGAPTKPGAAPMSPIVSGNSEIPEIKSPSAEQKEPPTMEGAKTPEDAKPGTLKASLPATPAVRQMTEQSHAHSVSAGGAENLSPTAAADEGGGISASNGGGAGGGSPAKEIGDHGGWMPTSDWVQSWKQKLPLQTIMRLLQVLVPQVEKICIDKYVPKNKNKE